MISDLPRRLVSLWGAQIICWRNSFVRISHDKVPFVPLYNRQEENERQLPYSLKEKKKFCEKNPNEEERGYRSNDEPSTQIDDVSRPGDTYCESGTSPQPRSNNNNNNNDNDNNHETVVNLHVMGRPCPTFQLKYHRDQPENNWNK